MDVLDEKANGVPPMEVEEVVSVRDRESLPRSVCNCAMTSFCIV